MRLQQIKNRLRQAYATVRENCVYAWESTKQFCSRLYNRCFGQRVPVNVERFQERVEEIEREEVARALAERVRTEDARRAAFSEVRNDIAAHQRAAQQQEVMARAQARMQAIHRADAARRAAALSTLARAEQASSAGGAQQQVFRSPTPAPATTRRDAPAAPAAPATTRRDAPAVAAPAAPTTAQIGVPNPPVTFFRDFARTVSNDRIAIMTACGIMIEMILSLIFTINQESQAINFSNVDSAAQLQSNSNNNVIVENNNSLNNMQAFGAAFFGTITLVPLAAWLILHKFVNQQNLFGLSAETRMPFAPAQDQIRRGAALTFSPPITNTYVDDNNLDDINCGITLTPMHDPWGIRLPDGRIVNHCDRAALDQWIAMKGGSRATVPHPINKSIIISGPGTSPNHVPDAALKAKIDRLRRSGALASLEESSAAVPPSAAPSIRT